MVADIDLKLLASATRMEYNRTAFWDAVRKTINKWAAEEKIDDLRVTQLFELVRISEKTRKNIDKGDLGEVTSKRRLRKKMTSRAIMG